MKRNTENFFIRLFALQDTADSLVEVKFKNQRVLPYRAFSLRCTAAANQQACQEIENPSQ